MFSGSPGQDISECTHSSSGLWQCSQLNTSPVTLLTNLMQILARNETNLPGSDLRSPPRFKSKPTHVMQAGYIAERFLF